MIGEALAVSGSPLAELLMSGVRHAEGGAWRLRVPRVEWTRAKKQVLGLHIPVEPSNFCFSDGLPKSIGGQRLGFAPKAVQWGIDGANRCGDGLRGRRRAAGWGGGGRAEGRRRGRRAALRVGGGGARGAPGA